MTNDYRPIDCGEHDRLELAIMRRVELVVDWLDDRGVARRDIFIATDLLTRNGEEFMVVLGGGVQQEIRLDRIKSWELASKGASA